MKRNQLFILLAAGAAPWTSAAAQTPTQFQWLNSDPTFATRTNTIVHTLTTNSNRSFLAVADADGDGDVDAVSGLNYLENEMVLDSTHPQGDYGAFNENSTCAIDPFLSQIAKGTLADLNGDGLPELVGIATTGSLGVWANTLSHGGCAVRKFQDARSAASGSWIVPAFVSGAQALVVGDFDGDGDRDIVVGGTGGITLVVNSPQSNPLNRKLTVSTVSLTTTNVSVLSAGDFDGDGDLDLAIGGGTLGAGIRLVALNNGAGSFTLGPALPAGGLNFPQCVTTADVDGDGDLDIVFGHMARVPLGGTAFIEGGLQIFANNGAGTFSLAQTVGALTSFTGVAVGDIDEDGLVDIVACTRQEAATISPGVNIFSTVGTRVFGRPSAGAPFADLTLAAGSNPGRLGTNSALSCSFPGVPAVPIVDGFDPATCLPLDGTGIALADIDLDGDLDILVSYRLLGTFGVFSNLLWQLETPRTATAVQGSPGSWTWTLPYDMYCEFNVPNVGGIGALGAVGVSLTPPVHVFPAGPLGVATTAPYVMGPTTFVPPGAAGQYPMTLGPFPTSVMTSLIGTKLYAQGVIFSLGRNVIRLAKVVETTLQ